MSPSPDPYIVCAPCLSFTDNDVITTLFSKRSGKMKLFNYEGAATWCTWLVPQTIYIIKRREGSFHHHRKAKNTTEPWRIFSLAIGQQFERIFYFCEAYCWILLCTCCIFLPDWAALLKKIACVNSIFHHMDYLTNLSFVLWYLQKNVH